MRIVYVFINNYIRKWLHNKMTQLFNQIIMAYFFKYKTGGTIRWIEMDDRIVQEITGRILQEEK